MFEKDVVDFDTYIQERLQELDDLDERRFAKEILWDGLRKVLEYAENKYQNLERRIYNEIRIPTEKYMIAMLICAKNQYDPSNVKFFPICSEDMKPSQKITVFLDADRTTCEKFLRMGEMKASDKEGNIVVFQIKKSIRYLKQLEKIYRLFTGNHLPWNTVHTGYLDRFYDLILTSGDDVTTHDLTEYTICEDEFAGSIKYNLIPLWNLKEMLIEVVDFMIPCPDGKYYEHVVNLNFYEENSAYLVEAGEEILEVRYEAKKIIVKTKKEEIDDFVLWQFGDGEPDMSAVYQYGVLSNKKRDSFAGRYLYSTGNFLQTRLELIRKVEELNNGKELTVSDFKIVDEITAPIIYADMNYFISDSVFPREKRKKLLFIFKRPEKSDFLYIDDIRYVLSQMQMEYMEYQCVGIVE